MISQRAFYGAACIFGMLISTTGAKALTIDEAIRLAVTNNPKIGEARANRRAVDQELNQAWGAFLPKVDASASYGRSQTDAPNSISSLYNDNWYNGRQASLTVREVIFDGFSNTNELYRQSARVDGAALRVLERSEVIALDAAEAYIDIVRHGESLRYAQENTRELSAIFQRVQDKYKGGSAGIGELEQARERVEASRAVEAEIRKSLEDAKSKFRSVVGIEPVGLKAPHGLGGLPASRVAAVRDARLSNPTIRVSEADADAAKFDYEKSKSSFYPTVALEGQASAGHDINGVPGRNKDLSARAIMTFNIFNGGIDKARSTAAAERMTEARIHQDTVRRDITETAEKAWTARTTSAERIRALRAQLDSSNKVVSAYRQEYEAAKRTLLDLLDSENSRFNARLNLATARAINLFSQYQLAAAIGKLTKRTGAKPPIEAVSDARVARGILPPLR